MSVPRNRNEFIDHCKRRLGWPVIDLDGLEDDQIEDRVDEALAYWRKFHHDAVQKTYMKHQITQTDIDNQYIPANNDVFGVTRVFPTGGSSGSGNINMFDYRYQLRLNDFSTFQAGSHIDYYLINQHINQIDMMYVGEIPFNFNRHMDRVYLYWDWVNDAILNEYIILEVDVALDEETFTDIWSDDILQEYATALMKRQMSQPLKLFGGTVMLGGVAYNGQEMYAEATQEIAELRQRIREEYEVPPHFITG